MRRVFAVLLICFTGAFVQAETNVADVAFPILPELEHPVGVEVLFSPNDNIEARIIKAISGAKFEILINHYLITSPAVREAIIAKYRGKIQVICMLDANPSVRDYQGIKLLKAAGVPVVTVSRTEGHWNNSKYLIIDRDTVLFGTGDLTNAARRNNEVLMVMREPSIVVSFYNNFVFTARASHPKP